MGLFLSGASPRQVHSGLRLFALRLLNGDFCLVQAASDRVSRKKALRTAHAPYPKAPFEPELIFATHTNDLGPWNGGGKYSFEGQDPLVNREVGRKD